MGKGVKMQFSLYHVSFYAGLELVCITRAVYISLRLRSLNYIFTNGVNKEDIVHHRDLVSFFPSKHLSSSFLAFAYSLKEMFISIWSRGEIQFFTSVQQKMNFDSKMTFLPCLIFPEVMLIEGNIKRKCRILILNLG